MDSLDAKDSGCSWWPWECCFGQKDEQGAVDPTRSTSSRSVPGFNPTAAAFVPKQVLTQRTVGGRPDAVEDPSRLYRTIEHNYMLSRLEEKPILVAALSLVVREMAGGRQICFPAPEAVDRMFVTSHGLPQDVGLLYQLIGEAYHRRGVPLDMDKVKRDFIKAHGRLMFNKTKKFKNFIVVRY